MIVVARRGYASCNRRTHYLCRSFQVLRIKAAVDISRIVYLVLHFSKGIEISSFYSDESSSRLRASFWVKFSNLWPVVVVVEKGGRRVLTAVLGNRNWNGLCNDVGLGTLAGQVGRVDHVCNNCMGTERDESFPLYLFEILSPNLNVVSSPGFIPSVLWAVLREDSLDDKLSVVIELHRVDRIREITSHTDLEFNTSFGILLRVIVALDTSVRLK